MINFVRETIDDSSKYELVNTITEFYGSILQELYKVIAAVGHDLRNPAA